MADAGHPSKGVSMKPKTDIRPVLKPGALYLGDNGRCFCTEHAGMRLTYSHDPIGAVEPCQMMMVLIGRSRGGRCRS